MSTNCQAAAEAADDDAINAAVILLHAADFVEGATAALFCKNNTICSIVQLLSLWCGVADANTFKAKYEECQKEMEAILAVRLSYS